IGARIGQHVSARADERLQDVRHLVGRDVPHRDDFDDELVFAARSLAFDLAERDDGTRLRLGDGENLIEVPDLHGGDAIVPEYLVQEREEVLARDLAGGADGDLALDARVDGVADAERGREAVDHLADVRPLEVEDHRLFFTERLLVVPRLGGRGALGVCGPARCARHREQDQQHPSPLHANLLITPAPASRHVARRPAHRLRPGRRPLSFCFSCSSFWRTSSGNCWADGITACCGICTPGGGWAWVPGAPGAGAGTAPRPAPPGRGTPGRGVTVTGALPFSTTSAMVTGSPDGELSVTPVGSMALMVYPTTWSPILSRRCTLP